MKIQDYQEKAGRTCNDLKDIKLNLCHMALGIHSELSEYAEAMEKEDVVNQREELADICWYVANYATFRGYSFEDLLRLSYNMKFDVVEENLQCIGLFSSRLSDYVKKFIAYDRVIDRGLEQRALAAILKGVNDEDCMFNFEKDLGNNIAKLEARYPEKFTNELAVNRNLKVEREILER